MTLLNRLLKHLSIEDMLLRRGECTKCFPMLDVLVKFSCAVHPVFAIISHDSYLNGVVLKLAIDWSLLQEELPNGNAIAELIAGRKMISVLNLSSKFQNHILSKMFEATNGKCSVMARIEPGKSITIIPAVKSIYELKIKLDLLGIA